MRFGLFVPQGWRHDLVGHRARPAVAGDARRGAPRRGSAFESIWVYDHFHTVPVPSEEATHEAWTLMAAFGAATSRVRLGQMCTCMGYRNPAYLAKVAATVDVVSGGRIEMGIGAGWYEHEWRAYGYGFPTAGDRLATLAEGVEIMRQAWEKGVATYAGEHYQVDGAICRPTPLQPGGIPLWIAGGGEKKTLRIAAQYADYTNFDGSLEGFRHKSQVLADHCRELGRDFGEIVRIGELQRLHRARRGRGRPTGCGRSRTGCGRYCRRRRSRPPCSSTRPGRWSAPPSRSSSGSPSCRTPA